jgi:DegV family protein with EDD domain
LIATRAAACAAAGGDLAEVERATLEARSSTLTYACLTTLEYAVRGGRVPAWAKRITDLLRVMPLLAVHRDGRVSIGGVLFGRRSLTEKFARFVRRRVARDRCWRLAVGHANAKAEGEALRQMIMKGMSNINESYTIPIGTALGVHGGPGCLVVSLQEVGASQP